MNGTAAASGDASGLARSSSWRGLSARAIEQLQAEGIRRWSVNNARAIGACRSGRVEWSSRAASFRGLLLCERLRREARSRRSPEPRDRPPTLTRGYRAGAALVIGASTARGCCSSGCSTCIGVPLAGIPKVEGSAAAVRREVFRGSDPAGLHLGSALRGRGSWRTSGAAAGAGELSRPTRLIPNDARTLNLGDESPLRGRYTPSPHGATFLDRCCCRPTRRQTVRCTSARRRGRMCRPIPKGAI